MIIIYLIRKKTTLKVDVFEITVSSSVVPFYD